MAKHYTKLIIEINENINSIVTAVKGDVASRFLDVQLYSNGTPIDLTSHTVTMSAKSHPDSNFKVPIDKFIDGVITDTTNGRCQFELKTDILGQTGVLILQISIFSGQQEVLSTNTFNLYVLEGLRNDEQIEASNEFGALVVLFSEIQNALDDLHAIALSFGSPGEKAQSLRVDTFWKMLEALYVMNEESLANVDVAEVQRVVDEINRNVGNNADVVSNNTLFGFAKNSSTKSDSIYEMSDVFDLLKLKMEVAEVTTQRNETAEKTFSFSSGKKKIKFISYNGNITGSYNAYLYQGDVVFNIDGTQYNANNVSSTIAQGFLAFLSHAYANEKITVELKDKTDTTGIPLTASVKNSFSVKAKIKNDTNASGNVKMIIYYV